METLSDEQNNQLQRSLEFEYQVELPTSTTATQVTTFGCAAPDTSIKSVHKGKNSESVQCMALERCLTQSGDWRSGRISSKSKRGEPGFRAPSEELNRLDAQFKA